MAKKHGSALLDVPQFEVPQCLELASAVVAALPRDIDPNVAQGWIEPGNRRGLRKVLREALMPPDTCVGKPTKPITAPANWYEQIFQFAVQAGNFVSFCHAEVTAEHFPYVPDDLDDNVKEVEVKIDRDMTTERTREHLTLQGLEGVSAFRLIRWWFRHPERQKNFRGIAFGQEWKGWMAEVYGKGDHRSLTLELGEAGGYTRDSTILAVETKKQ